MDYNTYNEYKDSGNKWIGKIPINWHIIKAKFCFNISHGHYFKSDDFVNEGVNLVRIGNIVNGTIELDNCVKLPYEYYCLFKEHIIKSNDLLIALSGATIGKIGYVPKTSKLMLMNYRVGKINCDNPNYYKYLLNSHFIQTQIKFISEGSAQENIGNKDFDELMILDIDDNTKRNIVNYLDKKTSKIDETILKNQQLIELLEEKRIALINHVVTKGLNPDVPMKDSGVEWIGEIPKHWDINPLKSVANIIMGQSPDSNDINDEHEGFLFMQGNADFTNKYPNPSEYCIAPKKISRVGDILMSVRAPVGELNISDKRYGIGRGLCSIKPINVTQSFLWYYLLKSKSDFNYYSNGSTFDAITIGNLSSFPITIPKLNEQKRIGNYLNKETSKIEKIIEKITMNIKLLEEYKTSLIHHVVTGKIDVRGEEI